MITHIIQSGITVTDILDSIERSYRDKNLWKQEVTKNIRQPKTLFHHDEVKTRHQSQPFKQSTDLHSDVPLLSNVRRDILQLLELLRLSNHSDRGILNWGS